MDSILIQKQSYKPKLLLISPNEQTFVTNGQLPLNNLTKTLRIQMNTSTRGFVDGRESMLSVTIAVPQTMLIGGLILDTCPQNLIQNWVLRYKGNQIQRFNGQHRVGTIFNDMGKLVKQQIQHGKRQNFNINKAPIWNVNPTFPINAYNNATQCYPGGMLTTTGYIPTQFSAPCYSASQLNNNTAIGSIQQFQKATLTHLSTNNPVYASNKYPTQAYVTSGTTPPAWSHTTLLPGFTQTWGSTKNVRSEYVGSNKKGIQSTSALNTSCMQLNPKLVSQSYPWQFDNKTPYSVTYPALKNAYYVQADIQTGYQAFTVPNSTNYCGFSKPYDPSLYAKDPQIILSNTIPSVDILNGQFLANPVPLIEHTFDISIPSSIFGIYAPQHQYARYPMQMLHNCTMQITFNKYAFYSTGYADVSEYDTVGMSVQIPRAYVVKNIQLNLKWYDYQIPDLYRKKILGDKNFIETDIWQTLGTYTITKPGDLNGFKQLTLPYTQLSELIIAFYSLDYTNYSFCRQNYRLSYNVLSMQVRYAGKYYPASPYEGNGGNPSGILNNNQFLLNLTHSKLYSPQYCSINKRNFAVNDRPYNPANQNTLYNSDTYQCQVIGSANSMDSIFQNPVNMDTAMGQSTFHQQRCKGQALYVIPFNNQVIMGQQISSSGLNITQGQTLELIIEVDNETNFSRNAEMVIIGCFRKKVQRDFKQAKVVITQVI